MSACFCTCAIEVSFIPSFIAELLIFNFPSITVCSLAGIYVQGWNVEEYVYNCFP